MHDTGPLHLSHGQEATELDFGDWFAFWIELIVLGLCVVLGAVFASADAIPGDYACGLILALAAIGLGLLRIKARFDGVGSSCAELRLVDDWPSLGAVIVVFTILGLGGAIVAAGVGTGGLYSGGVALFVVSWLVVLGSMKHVFDKAEGRR